jgi:uncharacterized protein YjeT (DUF2065 family)
MPLSPLEILAVALGLLCVAWGLFALRYPRYSYVGATKPDPVVEEDEDDDRIIEVNDPVRWRGWKREKETFTVAAQRRAGVMVIFAGGVLLWVGIA